jgi:hypothetical protein
LPPDDAKSECFPPALKFKLNADGQPTIEADELLAADAQEEGDGKNLALAKVVAGLTGVPSDGIFRRADRERRAAVRRRRRVQTLIGVLGVLLIVGLVGWINQDYLREQYYWHLTMRPRVLTAEQEHALEPKDEFAECAAGCPNMVVIPAGAFVMGSPDSLGQIGERPQHDVTIAQPFALGKYEVTFAEWDACVAAGACPFVPDNQWGRDDQPVINVSRSDAERSAMIRRSSTIMLGTRRTRESRHFRWGRCGPIPSASTISTAMSSKWWRIPTILAISRLPMTGRSILETKPPRSRP